MEIGTCMLTENNCYKANVNPTDNRYATFQNRGPMGIMLHSTGCNNPNLRRYLAPNDGIIGENAYDNHWNKPDVEKCCHAMIGKDKDGTVRTYQTLPWNFRGWHCGGGANDTHLSIEMLEDRMDDRAYFEAVISQAVELMALLCKEFGLDPLTPWVIIDHAEGYNRGVASDHSDCAYWLKRFGWSMDKVRQAVHDRLKAPEQPEPAPGVPATTKRPEQPWYHLLGDVPAMYRGELDWLVANGHLKGHGGEREALILDMAENEVRILVIMARALQSL